MGKKNNQEYHVKMLKTRAVLIAGERAHQSASLHPRHACLSLFRNAYCNAKHHHFLYTKLSSDHDTTRFSATMTQHATKQKIRMLKILRLKHEIVEGGNLRPSASTVRKKTKCRQQGAIAGTSISASRSEILGLCSKVACTL